jgi:hypothetical protein
MVAVGKNEKHVLENRDVELAEEDARCLRVSLGHVVHQFQAHCETCVLDLSVVVFRCPHARVDDELELSGIKLQERLEAVQIDGLKKFEKLHAMFRILVEVLVDHLQSAAEHAVHDGGNLVFHQGLYDVAISNFETVVNAKETYVELVDDCGHGVEDFCFACVGDIAVIVNENGLEQRRHHIGINHLKVVRLFHICVDELQDFLFDGSKTSDFGSFWRNAPCLVSVTDHKLLAILNPSLMHLPSLATASLMSWLEARYMFNMS